MVNSPSFVSLPIFCFVVGCFVVFFFSFCLGPSKSVLLAVAGKHSFSQISSAKAGQFPTPALLCPFVVLLSPKGLKHLAG